MTILVDSNILVALALQQDKYHLQASTFIRQFPQDDLLVLLPSLFELFYVCEARAGYLYAVQAYASARKRFNIEYLNFVDLMRMQVIGEKYASAKFDLTDIALMAVAERLHIRQIATFDRRDFSIYQPAHCAHFDLLPEDF